MVLQRSHTPQEATLEANSEFHWAQCTFCRKWRLVSAEISAMAEVGNQPSLSAAKLRVHASPARNCSATASAMQLTAQMTEEWRCDMLNSISCSSPDDWDMLQRRLQRAAARTSARQEATQAAMAAVEVGSVARWVQGTHGPPAALRAACT